MNKAIFCKCEQGVNKKKKVLLTFLIHYDAFIWLVGAFLLAVNTRWRAFFFLSTTTQACWFQWKVPRLFWQRQLQTFHFQTLMRVASASWGNTHLFISVWVRETDSVVSTSQNAQCVDKNRVPSQQWSHGGSVIPAGEKYEQGLNNK